MDEADEILGQFRLSQIEYLASFKNKRFIEYYTRQFLEEKEN